MAEADLQFSWTDLRATPEKLRAFFELIYSSTPPVDVSSIIQKWGVSVSLSTPLEMGDILPHEIATSLLPDIDETRIDAVLSFDEKAAKIFINRAGPPTRCRFTLAVFLGHLLRAPPGTYVRTVDGFQSALVDGSMEFASEFLMPDVWLDKACAMKPLPTVEALAERFGVSVRAMDLRLGGYHERLFPNAEAPWRELGISPRASLDEAEQAFLGLIHQHRAELFTELPAEYGELAETRRRELQALWAELQLQHVLRLPGGIPRGSVIPSVSEVVAVLNASRGLISSRGWCQKVYARDGYGKKQVRFDSDNAGKFSIVGAVFRAACSSPGARDVAVAVIAKVLCVSPDPRFLTDWNDAHGRTREDILEVLGSAIDMIERGAHD